MSHTKGPWELHPWTKGASIESEKCQIVFIESRSCAQWRANARLIAAAPCLLAACEELMNTYSGSYAEEEAREKIEAAIKKARGEA